MDINDEEIPVYVRVFKDVSNGFIDVCEKKKSESNFKIIKKYTFLGSEGVTTDHDIERKRFYVKVYESKVWDIIIDITIWSNNIF